MPFIAFLVKSSIGFGGGGSDPPDPGADIKISGGGASWGCSQVGGGARKNKIVCNSFRIDNISPQDLSLTLITYLTVDFMSKMI